MTSHDSTRARATLDAITRLEQQELAIAKSIGWAREDLNACQLQRQALLAALSEHLPLELPGIRHETRHDDTPDTPLMARPFVAECFARAMQVLRKQPDVRAVSR